MPDVLEEKMKKIPKITQTEKGRVMTKVMIADIRGVKD